MSETEIIIPMSKAVAQRKEETAPAPVSEVAAPILSMLQAVMADPTMSLERINQAFDFYQRVDAAQAKKAFDAAMADARAEFTPVIKRHQVSFGKGDGATNYKHEDLADYATMVDPILGSKGLSYRYRATSNVNEPIRVTCIVTHRAGHSEETTLSAGADAGGGKNSIQAIGSTLTYLQRYSLRLALGLAAGRDTDGNGTNAKPAETITAEQAAALKALAKKANIELQIIHEFFSVSDVSELTPDQHKKAVAKVNKKLELEGVK